MKYNMGCGFNKLDGYVNVDKYNRCAPDLQIDLEVFPWPIQSNSVSEILFNHSLEHLGHAPETFLEIIKEIYRICQPNAKILINVPHPRHDYFLGDPTHVRPITPLVLSLFSKANNKQWIDAGMPNTPLAMYLDVDFEILKTEEVLDARYSVAFNARQLSASDIQSLAAERNNVIQDYRFTLRALK